MTYSRAESVLNAFFAPLTIDDVFDALGRRSFEVQGANSVRRGLFGEDPKHSLLAGFATHATQLKSYGVAPASPPPAARAVGDPSEFDALIKSFHERDYTVRVPDVVPLSPRLQEVTRALETVLKQPVQSALFWSKAEAKAIIHYDKRDNIAVQLEGRKRWFISTDPPGLQNNWEHVGEPVPQLPRYRVVDAEPGDLIYIPRGTPHTVESTSESLHLAILFIPTTLREAIIAALDYLSDSDPDFREPAFARPAGTDLAGLSARVRSGLERVLERCHAEDFLADSLDLQASRMVSALPSLPKPSAPQPVTRDTMVRHTPLAISHLRAAHGTMDFTLPGEHIAIHRGVERELRFIAATEQFRVGDLPGESSDDVRVALVNRLVASGLLEPC
jgi:hypothetical protein